MKTYTEKRFFEWHEDEVSVTLRNKSGSYGGGSEVFVVDGMGGVYVPMIVEQKTYALGIGENAAESEVSSTIRAKEPHGRAKR